MSDHRHQRRTLLKGAVAVGVMPLLEARAAEDEDPSKARPQAGDQFVFFSGERKGEVITIDALPLGGPQIMAYPIDPNSDTIRDGSRLNQVVLVRLEPDDLSEEASVNAAEGVVAYSAVCSHQACPVSMWRKQKGTLYCSCHGSEFDPKDAAKVVAGPAKRRLAMVPLATEDGTLVATGPFTGRVGPAKR